jgi:predicted site-specific integrase-resolvase
MPNTDLISTAEAADILGVNIATVNRWAVAGRIEPTFTGPGKTGARMFARTEVERVKAEVTAA